VLSGRYARSASKIPSRKSRRARQEESNAHLHAPVLVPLGKDLRATQSEKGKDSTRHPAPVAKKAGPQRRLYTDATSHGVQGKRSTWGACPNCTKRWAPHDIIFICLSFAGLQTTLDAANGARTVKNDRHLVPTAFRLSLPARCPRHRGNFHVSFHHASFMYYFHRSAPSTFRGNRRSGWFGGLLGLSITKSMALWTTVILFSIFFCSWVWMGACSASRKFIDKPKTHEAQ